MMKLDEARQTLMRGLKLRCPACGQSALYESVFRMRKRCSYCGLVFEREQGYFVGAIYINVIATESIILFIYLFFTFILSAASDALYVILFVVAVTLPLIFFRFSRSLWLSIDHIVSPRRNQLKGLHHEVRHTFNGPPGSGANGKKD